jgi:hypothetical protein
VNVMLLWYLHIVYQKLPYFKHICM